jgi:hypothetical protein
MVSTSVPQAVNVTAADPQYPDCVRGLNQRYIGKPDVVHIVNSTDQVAKAVQEAVRSRRRLSVISGGHCFEDFIFNADVKLVIDMSKMNRIYFDRERNAVAVEPGASVLEVYETMYKDWGVTIPAGFCYSVGMGGYVAGGGWGPLCRSHGLVVDHLYAVEVVVVDAAGRARAVVATREENDPNRDLWWAHTGGGGGNFGVVTRYWFRSPDATGSDPRRMLPRPPREVLVNAVSWPWSEITEDEFAALARNYSTWHVANRAPTSPNRALTSYLILNHRFNGQLGLINQVDATVRNPEAILESYLSWMRNGVSVAEGALTNQMAEFNAMPELSSARRLPWLQTMRFMGTTNSALNDPTYRAEYKSAFMRGSFTDEQLEALHRHLTRPDITNPLVGVQLTPYGGQVGALGPQDTASVHRGAVFKMLWSAQWTGSADDDTHINWARESYSETFAATGGVPVPNEVTDGCYVNYPDIDLSSADHNKSSVPWHDLYYKENYPRLQQVKKRWDPTNFFRHKQSIELPN